ncbi:winged helix-turn-helix transcriptional regulator [Glycomyces buryatensis]|uniref:Helix-turn-helix transcriptional regulator n=1 Tax=Glycomyces buryatensis TaxID=2570927 RepID=A0A4S8Q9K6_9ACTN|nr:helix-turn-helix domain-containing protein [Glycomyces buryatensis]THV40131.1 helix-turn-helix transcriptional regulator [Glycomyces buryatensis]
MTTEAAGTESPSALEFLVLAKDCVSRPVLGDITGRWGTLVLLALREDSLRFSEIRRHIEGINEKALSQSLRALERDGFVERHAEEGFPVRVEYNLTELGATITDRLQTLVDELYSFMPDVLTAQSDYDRKHPAI